MNFIALAGIVIGLSGLGYAVYQGSERKKLIKLARSQSWFLYSKANNMTGTVQTAQKKYMEKHSTNMDNEICTLLSKSAAFGLDLFRETIRLIQVSEPKFDFKTIDFRIKQKKT